MNESYFLKDLESRVSNIKKRFLQMYYQASAGHIGCSLSCAEIITFLFFRWMNEDDEFILSKGHAAACLYSVLAEKGILNEEEINTFYKNGTFLAAHPTGGKINKIRFATGSLGHGLSLTAGLALAKRFKKSNDKIFCLTSDGELNEGSIWEAVFTISHQQLNNVVWLIDKNNFQGFGKTDEVMNLSNLERMLKTFDFEVYSINGHDFSEFEKIYQNQNQVAKPVVVICNTIKGNGWDEFENTLDSHYLPMTTNMYEKAISNLSKTNTQ